MVNPANVHAYLTQDLDTLPPENAHRAYSTPHTDSVGDEHHKSHHPASDDSDKSPRSSEVDPHGDKTYSDVDVAVEKHDGTTVYDAAGYDEERERVQAVARTSTYIGTFFLITTDVLGPSVAPWALSVLGWVPGSLVFFFLGVVATYTGLILLNLFVKLDTPEQPIRTFADIAERIALHWGPRIALVVRHTVAVLQMIQQLMACAVLIFGSAVQLSQLVNFSICFVECLVIFAVIGNVGGFIKAFRHLGYFANMSVWLNLTICFICMGVAQNTGALQYDDTTGTVTGTPGAAYVVPNPGATSLVFGNATFQLASTAISNIIYAYGGATMYVELMSEMKNPREFWKSLFMAEFIIIGMYFLFGLYFYSEMGAYVSPIPQTTLTVDAARMACNIIGLVTGIIAAVMYGNVGMKVLYYQIVVDLMKGPQLTTRKGTFVWFIMATVFWWVAFVIAGAVPNIQSIVGVVGSLCIMQFTYTFPPIMQFFYYWSQGSTMREKLTDKWALKLFDLTICMGSLAATGMGMWGSILSMIEAEQAGNVMGFSCTNPQLQG